MAALCKLNGKDTF